MPRAESVEIMSAIDAMPKPWRALVHEYGFVMVAEYRDEEIYSAAGARRDLENWRKRRQAEWLSTQYVRPRDLEF